MEHAVKRTFIAIVLCSWLSAAAFAQQPASDRPDAKLVRAIRERPWDESAVAALADWYAERDPDRARLICLDIKISALRQKMEVAKARTIVPYLKARYREKSQLIEANRARWTEALAPLGAQLQHVELEYGLIANVDTHEATEQQLRCLQAVPEVRQLSIDNSKLSLNGLNLLCKLPHLDELVISGLPLTDKHLEVLEAMPPWTNLALHEVEIDVTKIDAMNVRRIHKFAMLSESEKQSAAARFLSVFEYDSPLGKPTIYASLRQSGLRDPYLLLLTGLPDLETVYISECDITSRGIAHLAGHKKLKVLQLAETKVDSIASLKGLANLEELSIYPEFDTKLGDAGLDGVQNFSKLQRLSVYDDALTNVTLARIAPLRELRDLDLTTSAAANDEGLKSVAGLKNLTSLTLTGGNYSDAAFLHLAGLKQLSELNVRINSGTGEGFKNLAGLDKLEELALVGDGVNDVGLAHLAPLKGLHTIVSQQSAVSKQGAEKLAAALPNVMILLKEHVVKSPRDSVIFRRQKLNKDASLLIPENWSLDTSGDSPYLMLREDGWDHIGSWSSEFVGPSDIRFFRIEGLVPADKAMMEQINDNAHLNPKILQRQVQAIRGIKETASCIYENEQEKVIISVAATPAGTFVISCQSHPRRFAEFEVLFKSIIRSVQLGDDEALHAEQKLEVPTSKLRPASGTLD
jgi:internalin A